MVRRDDPTTVCPKCGRPGIVVEGESKFKLLGKPIALDGHVVSCGCPPSSNRIIAPLGELSSTSSTHSLTSNAVTTPIQTQERNTEKRVTDIYWSYGDDFTQLQEFSRHYTDLNLHIKTEHHQPGETVSVIVEYSDGDILINNTRRLTISGKTDSQGTITLRNIFKNGTLNLKYRTKI
jgi:hypothetical protein